MNGQRQFDRYLATLNGRHIAGATAQQVGHQRAHIDVVGIVVSAFSATIDVVWHSCPLCPVAGTLQCSWQSAGGSIALDIAHATSKADGIGCYYSFLVALVRERHAVELTVAFVEVEGSQVHPRASTHLLVDTELRTFTFMPYGVEGIRHTVLQRLVADIDSIVPCLREAGLVGCQRVARLAAGGLHHACRTCGERILAVGIGTCMIGKARQRGRLPLVAFRNLYIIVLGAIVVDNDFLLLPVALTGCEDDGSRLFQHRDEVGDNDGLCV